MIEYTWLQVIVGGIIGGILACIVLMPIIYLIDKYIFKK